MSKNNKDDIEILEFDDEIENSKKEEKVSKIKAFKEFISDKRNKAIVKLGIYGVFILIVVLYIRLSTAGTSKPVKNNNDVLNNEPVSTEVTINTITDKLKLLNENKDYSFNIIYIINNEEYNVSGEINNNKLNVYTEFNTYDNDENGFYEIIDDEKVYTDDYLIKDVNLYLAPKIYKYLEKANYQYKKEDLDGNVSINSLFKVSDFAYLNNNIVDSESNIIVETMENKTDNINNNDIFSFIVNIEFNYE